MRRVGKSYAKILIVFSNHIIGSSAVATLELLICLMRDTDTANEEYCDMLILSSSLLSLQDRRSYGKTLWFGY